MSGSRTSPQWRSAARNSLRSPVVLTLTILALALVSVALRSPYALITVLADVFTAAIVLLPAALAGLWLVPMLRLGELPLRWHFLVGAVLGLGALSLLILVLGLAGMLQRTLWICLEVLFAGFGMMRLRALLAERAACGDQVAAVDGMRYLWLLACPFLCLALLAASHAPGLLRQEEGFAYDVLEYHLQMPKEYFEAGRIEYAPHNVYANFPANVEMLYLLAMILSDGFLDAGTTANMIHLMLVLLTIYAAWVAGGEWSLRAGIVCAVSLATTCWLVYLAGLAYVENGVLMYGMTATAAMLRGFGVIRRGSSPRESSNTAHVSSDRALHWFALAGLLAGFACGCKYTAVPMIALPLGIAAGLMPAHGRYARSTAVAVFASAALLSFSPWLVKNLVMTGNPVFPLANEVFHADPPGWGSEETQRWQRGHTATSQQQTLSGKLTALWTCIPGDHYQRIGPVIFLLAFAGLLRRGRDETDGALLLLLIVQLAVWLFATHLYARFAVVLLIPLTLLAGRAVIPGSIRSIRLIVVGLIAGGAWNLLYAARLHGDESLDGAPASLIYEGQLPGYEYFSVVNHELPPDAKILLIGDAKAFYFRPEVDYFVVFNRNPLIEAIRAAGNDPQIIDWLRQHGYTHVLVHWREIDRLRATYGFPPEVTRELFNRLETAGLIRLREFPLAGSAEPYMTLYAVPLIE